jgi:phosphatidylserine/phosphatidylglycerophosphate/cardiolipin synthase-like enzyme
MIEQARASIDIEIYSMKDSSVFQALTRALDRGVKLRIVQEPRPVADPCRVFDPPAQADEPKCREQKNFVELVRSKGGRYEPFQKSLCGPGDGSGMCYQHGKILIVDSGLVAVSTGNFDASSFCHLEQNPSKCNRDYTVVSRDPKVVRAI